MFTLMLTLGKVYSAYPVAQIVFFRSAFALVPLLIWLLARGDFPRALYTKRPGGHFVRALAGMGSMFCIFTSYALLPLADATALGYASPLMTSILAAFLLGERMTALRWAAVFIGLAGVLVMLLDHLGEGPGAQTRSPTGAMFALAAAFLIAIAMIQTRRLTRTEDTGAITFYFQSTLTLVSVLVLGAAALWPPDWPLAWLMRGQAWIAPSAADWAPLIAIGLLGGVGQILMTQGYRFAPASVLATFDYSSLLFAVAIGFIVFGDVPTATVLVGAGIVISAGMAVVWQEQRRGKTPSPG